MKEIIKKLLKFREDRNWKKFHTGLKLSHKLMIEAAEVGELFEWGSEPSKEKLAEELADVQILLLYLANDFDIDLKQAVNNKIKINEEKYQIREYPEWEYQR